MRHLVGRSEGNRLLCACLTCLLLVLALALLTLVTCPGQAAGSTAPALARVSGANVAFAPVSGASVALAPVSGASPLAPEPSVRAAVAHTSTLSLWVQQLLAAPASVARNGLVITKAAATAEEGIVINGANITYTLTISNPTANPATDVLILDILPEESLSNLGCSDNCARDVYTQTIPDPFGNLIVVTVTRQLSWTVDTLAPGEVHTRSFWGKVIGQTDGTELFNRAYMSYMMNGSLGSTVSNDTRTTVHVRILETGQSSLSDTPNWLSDDLGGTLSLDWGDFDGDGFADLALGSTIGTSVYRNVQGRLVRFWNNTRLTYGVAWGDFDDDGDLELAAVGKSLDNTSVTSGTNYIYDLSGESVEEYEFISNEQLVRVAPGDYDNDGLLDIAVSTNSINAPCPIQLFRHGGDPDAPFDDAPLCINTEATAALGPMDYDNDGDLDLVVGVFPNETHLLINQAVTSTLRLAPTGGPFTNTALLVIDKQAPFLPYDFSWGDYDKDGLLDLAAAFPLDRRVRIYRNLPDAGLRLAAEIPTSLFRTPLAVAWGDMNGDGALDLTVADAPPRVYEYKGGKFVELPTMRAVGASGQTWGLGLSDVDNEGDLDLALTNRDGPSMLFTNFGPLLNATLSVIETTGATASASVAWGDVDGDRDLDLLFGASQTSVAAKRYLNILGRFPESSMASLLASGFGPHSVAFGDVNGDHDLDIALGVGLETGLQIYLAGNTGTPDWTSAEPHYPAYSVVWGDADDDGDLDLLVGRNGPSALYINRGTQLETTPRWTSNHAADTRAVAWGDLNGDRYLDFALGNNGQPNEVYRNNQDNTFTRVWVAPASEVGNTRALAWADYDGDGDMDLTVGNYGQPNLVYANLSGSLSAAAVWHSAEARNTTSLAWGDWDNEGDLDLAVGNDGQPDQVFENLNSRPGLPPRLYLMWLSAHSYRTTGVAWGDADGDGDLELAVSSRTSGQNGVYHNNYVRPSHSTSDFAPTMPLPNNPSYLSVRRPGHTDAAGGYSSAELLSGPTYPTVTVSYRLFDPDGTRIDGTPSNLAGDPILDTVYEYSLNGGATWHPATPMNAAVEPATTTLRLGYDATFDWNAVADEAISDNARFRVCAVQQNQIDVGRNPQRSLICAASPPFRVRGTTCAWPRGAAIIVNAGDPQPGESIRFQGIVAGGSGVLTYTWDFGDGTTGQGQVVYHTYDTNNNFLVTLVVRSQPCPIAKQVIATLRLPVGTGVPDIFLPYVTRAWVPTTTLDLAPEVPVIVPTVALAPRAEAAVLPAWPTSRPDSIALPVTAGDSPGVLPRGSTVAPLPPSLPARPVRPLAPADEVIPGPGIVPGMGLSVGWLPVTQGRGVSSNPSLSDDGMRVAFWSTADLTGNNADGNIEVFVADIGGDDTLTLTQVTESTGNILGGWNLSPALSDDGTRVAFFSDRDLTPAGGAGNRDANFEIFAAAADAWTPLQLTETTVGANSMPSIDGDGSRIVFVSDRNLVGANGDYNQEVFYYDQALARFVQVSHTGAAVVNSDAVISADGNYVAFISDEVLMVADLTDGSQFVIDNPGGVKRRPAISGDGRSLAFISDGDAWLVELGAGGVVTPTQITASPNALIDEPEISADGTRVAFVASGQVYFFDKGTKELSTVGGVSNARHPSLSADGTAMAVVANRRIFVTTAPRADLSVSKISEPYPLVPGAPLTYTVLVRNLGPSSAFTATVFDDIPSIVQNSTWTCEAQDPSTCGGHGNPGLISDTVNLLPGTTITYTIYGDLPADTSTEVVNTVTITPPEVLIDYRPENNHDTDTSSPSPQANLWVTKTVDDASPNEGDQVRYTITVGNVGPSDARITELTDILPSDLTYNGCVPSPGTNYNATTGLWNIPNLQVGGQATLQILATVGAGSGLPILNTASDLHSLATDPDLSDNSASVAIAINQLPRPVDDVVGVLEDIDININVLANDSDPDGFLVPSTLRVARDPLIGIISVTITPTIHYTPNADLHGVDSLLYRICDDDSACNTASVTITVLPVNDEPTFVRGPNQTVSEDAGLQTLAGWATLIDPGADNEADQSLTFITSNDNSALFASPPVVDTLSGTLTFETAPDAFGIAVVTVVLHDDGGTSNGGDDTSDPQTFAITVDNLNDPPTLDPISNQALLEDAPERTVPLSNITPGPWGEPGTVTLSALSSNPALIPHPVVDHTPPATAGSLSFTPMADMTGTATITVTVTDDGSASTQQSFLVTVDNVNDPPVAVDDAGATLEDTSLTIDVLANDYDLENNPLTVLSVGPASFGVPAVAPDGLSVTYTPDPDLNGSDTFTYTLFDGVTGTATASVTVVVTAVNDAPSFVGGSDQTVGEDAGPQTFAGWATGPSAGPADEFTQTLTFVTGSDHPSLFVAQPAVDATGTLTFQSAPDAYGTAAVTVTLSDNGGTAHGGDDTSDPHTFVITVLNLNDPPTLDPILSQSVREDSPEQLVPLTGIGPGPYGEPGTVTLSALSSDPALIPHPDIAYTSPLTTGSLAFTPAPDLVGQAVIAVTATDDSGLSTTRSFTVTVDNVNDPPMAVDDVAAALEDTPVIIDVLANDSDPESDPLAVLAVGPASIGVPAVAPGGLTVVYTPTLNLNGTDTFTYTLSDGLTGTATASVTIVVTAVNDAPSFAIGPDRTVSEDAGPQTFAGGATGMSAGPADEAGQALAFTTSNDHAALFAAQPAVDASGALTFEPAANAWGTATVTVTLSDNGGTANGGDDTSDPQTFVIDVTAVNDPPTLDAIPDMTVAEDQPVVYGLTGITAGPAESQALTVAADGVTPGWPSSLDGLHVLYTSPDVAGTLLFTPTRPATVQLEVTVADDQAAEATRTFTVTITDVNDPPVAVDDTGQTLEDTPVTLDVLANDTDEDGLADLASLQVLTQPLSGTATVVTATGVLSISYTPDPDWHATDTFVYRVCDHALACDDATVVVTVGAVNDAPWFTAGSDQAVSEDAGPQAVAGWATGIAAGPANEAGQVLAFTTSNDNAALFAAPPAVDAFTGTLTFQAAADAFGSATVTVTLADDGGTANGGDDTSDPQTFVITVNPINDAPVAVDDVYTTTEDVTLVVPAVSGVLSNDVEVDGDDLIAAIDTAPLVGTLVFSSTGAFTYTPEAGYTGVVTFSYTADDGVFSSLAVVSITVAAVNDPPVAQDDVYTTTEDVTLNVSAGTGVLSNDADPDNPVLTAAVDTAPVTGTLTLYPTGAFTYTPAADYTGQVTFTYVVSDGFLTDVAAVTIVITAVNDAPVAVDDIYSIRTGETLIVPVVTGTLANDYDVDSLVLTAGEGTLPLSGTLTLSSTGAFRYEPDAGWSGADTFTYIVSDGVLTDTGTVSIVVNDPPVAGDDAYVTAQNTARTVDVRSVLVNDTDPNGDALTVLSYTDPPHGTVARQGDGGFTYTPATGYTGSDSFDYVVSDGFATDEGTVTMTVGNWNDRPDGVNDTYTTNEDTPLSVASRGVLSNDTDPDPEEANLYVRVYTQPAAGQGTVTVATNGGFSYQPPANWNGTATFNYTVSDGTRDDNNQASVSITVRSVNDAPTFTGGADQAVNEDAGAQTVTGWATNMSRGPANESTQTLTFNVTNDNNALFSVQPSVSTTTGNLTYTPAADANGTAEVTVVLQDNGGTANGGDNTSDPYTFTITVNPVNDAPTFTGGADQTVNEDAGAQTVTGWATGMSAGPADESTQTLTFNVTNNTNTALFSVQPAVDATTGNLTYTPAANANGTAAITLVLQDNGGTANGGDDTSDAYTFDITVSAVNDAPTFTGGVDQAVSEDAGAQTVTGWATGMSAGPADESTQTLTFSVTNNTNTALFSVQPAVDATTGNLTYTPAANANGTAAITLVLEDNGGTANGGDDTSDAYTFNITVNPINDAPLPSDDEAAVAEGGTTTTLAGGQTSLLANDSDPEGDTLTLDTTPAVDPLYGTLVLVVDGTFSYTHDGSETHTDQFTYQVCDNGVPSECATAIVDVPITPVNDAPVAVDDSFSTAMGVDLTISAPGVLGNDTDAENDVLSAALVTGPVTGTLTLEADGRFTYTVPSPTYTGVVTFIYTASDGTLTDLATVTITVGVIRHVLPPATAATVVEGGTVTGLLWGGSNGPARGPGVGDTLRFAVTPVISPSYGVLTLTQAGIFTYTHDGSATSVDRFVYDVCPLFPPPESCITGSVVITITPFAVDVAGPDAGFLGLPYAFTTTVSGPVSLPVTYTWQATGQVPVTQTAYPTATHALSFTWDTSGVKHITVTVSNLQGIVSDTHALTLAPFAVALEGPEAGFRGLYYTFTATLSGPVSMPVTYTWQATAQEPVTESACLTPTHSVVYSWTLDGLKQITVTVSNAQGTVSATHAIQITPFGVNVDGPITGTAGLSYTFTTTVLGPVTLPVTYTWMATGQAPVIQAAWPFTTHTVPFTWTVDGVYWITVTVSNVQGLVADTHVITIGLGHAPTQIYLPLIVRHSISAPELPAQKRAAR